jgi:hypothetical protein
MKHCTPTPWIVDECEDANGNDTIRKADGSPNGGIEGDPIATVYDPGAAEHICRCVNNHDEMVALLKECREDAEERWMADKITALLAKL